MQKTKLPRSAHRIETVFFIDLVEARRIELLSETTLTRTSPGAVRVWSIPLIGDPTNRKPAPVAS